MKNQTQILHIVGWLETYRGFTTGMFCLITEKIMADYNEYVKSFQ